MSPEKDREDRHAAAIVEIIERGTIQLEAKDVLRLVLHLQTNARIQQIMINSVASVAAGDADWSAIDEAARLAKTSLNILDEFVFAIAEKTSDE